MQITSNKLNISDFKFPLYIYDCVMFILSETKKTFF